MPNSVNSTTCLVGRFNAQEGFSYQELEKIEQEKNWERHFLKNAETNQLKKKYYPAHIKAMIDTGEDYTLVRRYRLAWREKKSLKLNRVFRKEGRVVKIGQYPCWLEDVSLWFFPNGIVLFSIKFEDSGVDLNDLTWMHSQWKEWGATFDSSNSESFATPELDELLKPLAQYTQRKTAKDLTQANTKVRQYQVVQIEGNEIEDELLYEIGTFSRVGVIKDPELSQGFKPSNEYFKKTVAENGVSVYSDWKALALNDSFTVLAIDDKYADSELDKEGDGYRYFELLYMRSLFEEYYCFDRNNLFREQKYIDVDKQLEEIKGMERDYFYDDLSYDFLPPLLLRAMEKGLGLQDDRKELTEHIKQAYKEDQDKKKQEMLAQQNEKEKEQQRRNEEIERRNGMIVSAVQILAVFSTLGTLYQLIIAITGCDRSPWLAGGLLVVGIVLLCVLLPEIIRNQKR